MKLLRLGGLSLALTVFSNGCQFEKPDPVSAANAILNKHPSDFLDQLTALDALASKEAGLPPHPWMELLYQQSSLLKPKLAALTSDSAKVDFLNAWVFDSLGLKSIEDSLGLSYSLPSQVLANKHGSCLGLTLVYLALGRTLELPLYPVLMPGHIFVRYQTDAYSRNIETLRKGIPRSDSFYQATFVLNKRPWYQVNGNTLDAALNALLFNLANHHRELGEWNFALGEYQLVLEGLPGHPEALGNEGAVRLAMGDAKSAQACFQASLSGDSLSQAAKENMEKSNRIMD